MKKEKDRESVSKLLEIMARLRDPHGGCVWDLAQTFASIAPYTLEEAYEVVDAITRGNLDDLCDELGDLLLQVVYHARLAEEIGAFAFDDVVAGICDKMIRRHPNVFGDARVETAEAQLRAWEALKAEERSAARPARGRSGGGDADKAGGGQADDVGGGQAGGTGGGGQAGAAGSGQAGAGGGGQAGGTGSGQAGAGGSGQASALDGVTIALPALPRGAKLSARAARVGFDWPDAGAVREKLDEELAELDAARAAGDADGTAAEMGDTLFTLINLCRHLRLDPERCLREANARFETRFRRLEERVLARRGDWSRYDTEALERLWQKVKQEVDSGRGCGAGE